ncbi:MAG: S8/S53 family peptidase [Candidatus Dormibacteraeota bacterium]|nr:S8/S53 family peptidase [Candidatus Dormibacteraeota bacterium]
MRRRLARLGGCVVVSTVVLAACAPSTPQSNVPAATARIPNTFGSRTASLASAEHAARNLGPIPATTRVTFELTLASRNQPALSALLASGGRVTPAEYAAEYGPDPAAVAAVQHTLGRSGLDTNWNAGDVQLSVVAPATSVDQFFGISLDEFRLPDGSSFRAPLPSPSVPRSIAGSVTAITGMDTYRAHGTLAIVGENGLTPTDIEDFYNMTPLRQAGLDGAGETVMFPEWAVPDSSALNAYAQKFNLPPFNVQVKTDPSWGQPDTPTSDSAGEAALDLEIVHGIAPGAREVVYELGDPSILAMVVGQMIKEHPSAIYSSSIYDASAPCEEVAGSQDESTAIGAATQAAAAQGTTMFNASGDRGAYSCLAGMDSSLFGDVSVGPDAAPDGLTDVGGTAVFLASNGKYFRESAWGEPLEQAGGGGGYSTVVPRPAWQKATGLDSSNHRGIPDVSCNADNVASGWDIFIPTQNGPMEGPVGGTSAAAPCWAGITALIDEYLTQQKVPTVGFANPALYFFASNPPGLPAPALHDVTEGNNLHYTASAGWDAATGLGSPDVGALADDFVWYATHKPSSSGT